LIKTIIIMKRKPGLSQEEFSKYWKEKHAPLVLKTIPGLIKYVQNHRVKLSDREPVYDGVAELWYKDLDSFRFMSKWYRSDEGKILRDDEAKFMDTSNVISYICEEVFIK
jgi:uncharacterized protein (TIGR02118 family)